jgi:hypothetical protein
MGLLDRFRRDRAEGEGGSDEDHGTPPPVDVEVRSEQLIELDDALRTLARNLAADEDRMRNPGWAGRVSDYRAVAAEAATLERDGFDRADLTDLANQVVPLYRAGADVPEEYTAVAEAHDRVMDAADALRAVLPSEQAAPGGEQGAESS